MSQFSSSKIFLVHEDDDGYGFMCSESSSQPKRVYTMSWYENIPSIRHSYMSHEYLYSKAQQFVNSLLIDESPMHIAQYRMFNSYINWYEEFYKS